MRIFLLAAIDRADASYWFTSRRMRRAGMGTGTLQAIFVPGLELLGHACVVGAVLGHHWLVSYEEQALPVVDDGGARVLFTHFARARGAVVWYREDGGNSCLRFRRPLVLDDLNSVELREELDECIGELLDGRCMTFAEWCRLLRTPMLPCPVLTSLPWARAVVRGLWPIIHVVPLENKLRWKCVLPGTVAKTALKRWLRSLPAREVNPSPAAVGLRRGHLDSDFTCAEILDWIGATRELKQLRRARETTDKIGAIVAKHIDANPDTLLRGLAVPCYTVLRQARVRLDATVMLLWRWYWSEATSSDRDVALFLWIDSSPQRRGIEFLASSWDVFVNGHYRMRRKLPAIKLSRALWTAFGKALGLAWQVFLVAGHQIPVLYKVWGSIRSITTDMGVESGIIDQEDFLASFLRFLGVEVPPATASRQFLLPNCVLISGWKHKTDLWIRRGLSSLVFWPRFLQRIKALVQLLRDANLSAELFEWWRSRGLAQLADMIESGPLLKKIAQWRWGTLAAVLRDMSPWLRSFCQHFSAEPLKKARDRTNVDSDVDTICGAIRDNRFLLQFDFALDFTARLDRLQQFGATCWCHREAYERGEATP